MNGYLHELCNLNESSNVYLNKILKLIKFNKKDLSTLILNENILIKLIKVYKLYTCKRHLMMNQPLNYGQLCSLYFYTSVSSYKSFRKKIKIPTSYFCVNYRILLVFLA